MLPSVRGEEFVGQRPIHLSVSGSNLGDREWIRPVLGIASCRMHVPSPVEDKGSVPGPDGCADGAVSQGDPKRRHFGGLALSQSGVPSKEGARPRQDLLATSPLLTAFDTGVNH
jgi:hypothetical protein